MNANWDHWTPCTAGIFSSEEGFTGLFQAINNLVWVFCYVVEIASAQIQAWSTQLFTAAQQPQSAAASTELLNIFDM